MKSNSSHIGRRFSKDATCQIAARSVASHLPDVLVTGFYHFLTIFSFDI
jgi:hypothetical protein